ncbi:MAG TPA: PQQ-dependent sugar dehydrogenase [Gemmatimonadaceae bacterium]|nr:PQQ-dependent sugar dehydrogenase [Gemmatimonadaceae bacterium]
MTPRRLLLAALLFALPATAQTTSDPYTPIRATEGVIRVDYREFAAVPDIDGVPARMMLLTREPGTNSLFVNDMRGPLYRVSPDGRTVTQYVNIDDPRWGFDVQSQGRERGFQSFAFHPQFHERGAPGFGKFYTWSDVTDRTPPADFTPGGEGDARDTHDMVLLEWTARNPAAATYDGDGPRELLRVQHPYANHNGGQLAFNPLAGPGHPDFGMLYIGSADGGSGGDPMKLAQNMQSIFGKILRIDPLGRNSANGKYGIPADNPFASGDRALREIWASGMRNPQRFGWDSANGILYVADIGQGTVEELSPVPKGGNLGWNVWEGSFRFASRSTVDTTAKRGDPAMTYPIAEFDHTDPVLTNRAAATGVVVYRASRIPQLRNRILFGDMPSGEVFHISADDTTARGQDHIRRVLFNDQGEAKTLLQLIRQKNTQQGKEPAARADLRFGTGPDDQVFLLNKADGVIRLLVAPNDNSSR